MGLGTSHVNKVPIPSASAWLDPKNNNKCFHCLKEFDEYIMLARCKAVICDISCLMWALCCHAAHGAALIESLGMRRERIWTEAVVRQNKL